MNPREVLASQLQSSVIFLSDIINEEKHKDLFNYASNSHSRSMGEIILHMIRSFEYYLTGITTGIWETLPYDSNEYDSFEKLKSLFNRIQPRLTTMIENLSSEHLHKEISHLDHPAFGLNLIIELLYHHFEHLGQLQIYLRNNGLVPQSYSFLI